MGREQFLILFIQTFYEKSGNNRRSSKNIMEKAFFTINSVSRIFFSKKLKFTEEEVERCFAKAGFKVMRNKKGDFTWERFHANHILASPNTFANFKSQSNMDLNLAKKRSYPDKFKPETVEKLVKLKNRLNEFWKANQYLIE